jgi:hypothetical protein
MSKRGLKLGGNNTLGQMLHRGKEEYRRPGRVVVRQHTQKEEV